MTRLDATLEAAFEVQPEVSALACVDGRAGVLLGLVVRGEMPDPVIAAALSGRHHHARRIQDAPAADYGSGAADACVESDGWVHAFARVPAHPDFVVMGLAREGINVERLRAWLGEVAGRVGGVS